MGGVGKLSFRLNSKTFIIMIFIFTCIISLVWGFKHKPERNGDWSEYVGMTVSFSNHLTPNLTIKDIELRKQILKKNGFDLSEEYFGYFKDLKGNYYSYHFWFYSLINFPFFMILKTFHLDTLQSFQITNIFLLIFMYWWILFRTKFEIKTKFWIFLCAFLNPIWFYVDWIHPEVFSFVLIFVGLLSILEKKMLHAAIFTALASLQNPAISLITLYIAITETIKIWKNRKIDLDYFCVGISCSIVLFPYIWFWIHYRKLSIIGETSAGIDSISLTKIMSLFFDPNFGMIMYVPYLCLLFILLLLKRERSVWIWFILLLSIAIVNSTQFNWNSGMDNINRYSVWMIPMVVCGTIELVKKLSPKKFLILSLSFSLLSTILLLYYYQHPISYINFHPIAKKIIEKVPSLYNPPFEVFAERALGKELNNYYKDELPIIFADEDGIRKALIKDSTTNIIHYVSGETRFSNKPMFLMRQYKAKDDIFNFNFFGSLTKGWYDLEDWSGRKARWIKDDASMIIFMDKKVDSVVSFNVGTYKQPRNLELYLNDKLILTKEIVNEEYVSIPVSLVQGSNIIQMKTPDIIEPKRNERKLVFYIINFSLETR